MSSGNYAYSHCRPKMKQLPTDLRVFVQHLIQQADNMRDRIRQLERERDCLQQTITNLGEKCRNQAPLISQWAKGLLTPEQADAIVRDDRWVRFEEVIKELE
jgi:hypothetical protein